MGVSEDRRSALRGKAQTVLGTIAPDQIGTTLMHEHVLAYAPHKDVFAIIQMSNVGLSPEGQARAERVTRELVDAAIEQGGTYYLTYQLYPTPDQLHRAYPNAAHAFERKRFYDPGELFSSQFYERYGWTR